MNGVLVVDKPAGPTSHDIVAKVRRALGVSKVGHTGTLDPQATGVLVLLLGPATKTAQYFSGHDKSYEGTFTLGVTTNTLDAAGEVVDTKPIDGITESDIEAAFASFVGDIEQVPPMYSAKKQNGKKLYELARKGVEVERKPKNVSIYSFKITRVALPEVDFEVHCSTGTYVRVLAQDLGEKLGCGAHLSALRRTSAGEFTIDQALTVDEIVEHPESVEQSVLPVAQGLSRLRRIDLPTYMARMISSGHQLNVGDLRTLDAPEFTQEEPVTFSLDGGPVIAIARAEIASSDVSQSRRDRRAFKTERLLQRVA